MKSKKIISLLIIISFVFSSFIINPIKSNAESSRLTVEYFGYYDSTTEFDFTIYEFDKKHGTFNGHLIIDDGDTISFNKDVSGTINYYADHYVCQFDIRYRWLFTSYDAHFTVTVYPFEGIAYGDGGGGILLYSEDFMLTGTVDLYYSPTSKFSEDDMKMCMALSTAIYIGENNAEIKEKILYECENHDIEDIENEIYIYNADDSNPNNVEFVIINQKNNLDSSIDIIVLIRGTLQDEWQGNVQITGTSYDDTYPYHYNFNEAKESIKSAILNYYNQICNVYDEYDDINLIITGHSRGAAVSNLYAKEAIDVKNGDLTDSRIPVFDSVTAYTFACPNVEQYNRNMESSKYDSIYNFWFNTDIVPSVPPTKPTNGWNYWKYGRCYTIDLPSCFNNSFTIGLNQLNRTNVTIPLNKNINEELSKAFSQWKNVSDYYNKKLLTVNSVKPLVTHYTSLYDFLYNATYFMTSSKKFLATKALYDAYICPSLMPLLTFAITNFETIKTSHHYNTYNEFINGSSISGGYHSVPSCNVNDFSRLNYSSAVSNLSTLDISNENEEITPTEYNTYEVNKLVQFADYSDNNDTLEWDLDDPSTWTGITWNSDGNVTAIDFNYLWLTGQLDCSGFTYLTSLDLYANSLTAININGNENLDYLNCSFNDLSQSGLTLTDCTSLTELYCDGCGLVALNLSGLNDLSLLSCSFNSLIALNIESNTNLSYVNCQYNYLDLYNSNALLTQLDNLKSTNSAYINYYPQLITDNAIVNADEMQTLESFAKYADNNAKLDWLDNEGNISLHKLQSNVLFEYDGSQYRVTLIDISNLEVEGSLNLSTITHLKELYCNDTKLFSLNLNNNTELCSLDCTGSELEILTLPSNASTSNLLTDIYCEYNYLDTSMFTDDIIDNVVNNNNGTIEYINQKGDSSALQGAISFAETLNENDYSAESFAPLQDLLINCGYLNFDNLHLNQDEIDLITVQILEAIYDLKAYFNVEILSQNATITASNDLLIDEANSVLYGTTITLNATPDTNCTFAGWYDTVSKIYLSNQNEYTFIVDSNISLKAVCIPDTTATLTFETYSGWIAESITKSTTEWADFTSINDLLPSVPYKYGYSNGRWIYDEANVLLSLVSGNNVIITAEYVEDNNSLPTPRTATDAPLLDLYYNYDSSNMVGSFVMAAGLPEDIQIKSVGIAFYYEYANRFDPTDNFTLLLNNKMLVGRFNTDELDDIYIVNMNKMSSTYNWAVRGFVTYYDSNNDLKTVYSNQINIIDTQEIMSNPNLFDEENNDNTNQNDPYYNLGLTDFNGIEDLYVDLD